MIQIDPPPVPPAGLKVVRREADPAAAERGPLPADIVAASDEVGARLCGPAHH